MRKLSVAIFALAFSISILASVPAISFADTSITGKTDCAAGSSSADPSGQQTFGATAAAAKDIQAYMYKAESCASACFDENISVQVSLSILSPSVTVVVKATNQCGKTPITQPSKAQPPRGCAAAQTQPQITLQVPDVSLMGTTYLKQQTIGPKSRCYGAVASTVGGLTAGGIAGMSNPAAVQSNFDNLNALSSQAPQGAIAPVESTIQGNTQLVEALTATGVSTSDAQKLASDPASAQALINAYATGNKDTIQDTVQDAAAKAGIALNDGVYDNISSLSASQVQATQSELSPLADQSGTTISGSTFDTSVNTSGVASTLAPLCNQLGGCGNVCPNAKIMVCNTNNPGALTWAAWEATYGGAPCGQANNTTCFPTMEQGIQAQARLLTTSNSYFASGTNTIWGEFCGSNYASGPGSNCAAYANFVSKETGIPVNQTIDPQNAQQIGAILMAQSRMESGVGVIFTPQQLETGLGLAYGTQSLPAGTPGYTPSTVSTGVGGLAGVVAGGSASGQVMLSSPFANVSALPTNAYQGTNAYTLPALGSNPITQPIQYTQPAQQTTTATSQSTQPALPVVQIIAQPKTVAVGGTITVSWSSAGMSAFSPCVITENQTSISSGNGGSKIVTATSTGTMIFSIACTPLSNAAKVTGTASVSVQ